MKTLFPLMLILPALLSVSCGQNEKKTLVEKIASIEAHVSRLTSELERKQKQMELDHDRHHEELDAKAEEAKALNEKLKQVTAEAAKAKTDVGSMAKQITELAALTSTAQEKAKADAAQIAKLKASLAASTSEADETNVALEKLRASVAKLGARIEGKDDTPAPTYSVVPDWPKYPEGKSLGSLHGDIASDSNGNVYLAVGSTIQVINAEGVYVRDLGEQWNGVHGMKVRQQDGEEFLFVAQQNKGAVSKLKLDGMAVWQILGHPRVEGMYEHVSKYKPTDVDVAPDGTIYIADGYGMSLIHIYDKDRNYVKTFGGKGTGDGQFNVCHNVLIDTRTDTPSLLISDRQNNRLQHHAMDGTFIKTIDAEMRQPCAADISGDVLAVGELGGRMSIYDKDNRLVTRLGDEPADRKKGNGAPPESWVEGALIGVHGCTFDAKGDLYAQEYSRFGRVVVYRKAE